MAASTSDVCQLSLLCYFGVALGLGVGVGVSPGVGLGFGAGVGDGTPGAVGMVIVFELPLGPALFVARTR